MTKNVWNWHKRDVIVRKWDQLRYSSKDEKLNSEAYTELNYVC